MDSYVDYVDENAAKIVVDSGHALLGSTITVNINVQNNPGLIGMKLLVSYDSDVLELQSAVANTENAFASIAFGPTTSNPFVLTWDESLSPNTTDNGVMATLTFLVKEDAAFGDTSIAISYDQADVFNDAWEDVVFATVAGAWGIVEILPGDANEDGAVNMRDYAMFRQHLSGWDVTVNTDVLDINADGKVNMRDLAVLRQYLSGWDVTLQ